MKLAVASDESGIPWYGQFAVLFVAVFCGIGGWLNLSWGHSLPETIDTSSRYRFSMREMLGAVAAIGVMTALTGSFIRGYQPKRAEHVDVADIADAPFDLPPNATDISYYHHGSQMTVAYEFTTDETSFRDWVASGIGWYEPEGADAELLIITTPVSITRHIAYSTDLTGPDSITVTTGLEYSWSFEEGYGIAVFDSTTNRAYYFHSQ